MADLETTLMQEAHDIAESWLNGNLTDAVDALKKMPPLRAAAVAMYITAEELSYHEVEALFALLLRKLENG